ncbi:MAG TPA: ABC transporter permease [Vicinamibacterales bacterium]
MRLYRLLLRSYPTSFRREYGEEMVRLFAERRRAASFAERIGLWLEALEDAATTAPRVHLDILKQDLRYTLRAVGRTPGFAIAVIVVMALGIGATTAVFSVTDRALLRPLPFTDPDSLVQVWEKVPGYQQLEPSPANYRDWTRMSGSFERLEAYTSWPMNMIFREPERVAVLALSAPLLPMLGAQPALGRLFTEEEGRVGGPNAAILSDRLWRRSFNADPSILGRSVRLDETTYTIVGIMPSEFYFPDRETELWVPLTLGPDWYEDRDNNFLRVVGRLKPGVTLEAAHADLDSVMAALEKAYPRENAQTRTTVRRLGDQVGWQSRLLLRVLSAASICLLLIACTNLASLLLTRFSARRHELTVRAALGAGQERLTRQLLTESLLLCLAGGAAGVAFAMIATPLIVRLVPTNLPVPDASVLDARVLLFAAVMTIGTGMAFGVVPAWRISRASQAVSLREGARGATGRERLRTVLVAVQIASSVLLLVSTGLFVRALERVQDVDPGFDAGGVLALRTALPSEKYSAVAARARFYERVLADVRALPGVTAAAYTSFAPLTMRGGIWPVEMPGLVRGDRADPHTASLRFLTPGYFETLRIPIVEGRDISSSDTFQAPFVAVVSESFAKRYWPAASAIGQRFTIAFHERIIVGVAGDVRVRGLESPSEPQVYLPYQQVQDGWLTLYPPKDLLVRTAGDPLAVTPLVRQIVRAADPDLPISDVATMGERVRGETAARRTQSAVLALFAGVAMLLAGVGLHGLLAYGVAQRRREIGVRMALGAPRRSVLRMIAGESAVLALVGVVTGTATAYAAARVFESMLAGVRPADPPTYLLAIVLAAVMTISGSLVPALRALRVDPVTALRAE